MMFRKMLFFASVATLVMAVGMCDQAEGALATSLMTLDGTTVNTIQDMDWESLLDQDYNETVSVGDVLYGMYQMESFAPPSGASNTEGFVGVFAFKVLAVRSSTSAELDQGISRFHFTLGVASDSEWDTIFGTSQSAKTAAGTMLTLYSDPDYDSASDAQPTAVNPGAGSNTQDALQTAMNGTKLWEFGFTGTDDLGNPQAADFNEFWVASTNSLSFSNLTNLLFAGSVNATSPTPGFDFVANNSLVDKGQGLMFAEVTSGAAADLQIFGNKGEAAGLGHFAISTNASLYMVATPEPSTWLALAGLGLIGLIGLVRRRWAALVVA